MYYFFSNSRDCGYVDNYVKKVKLTRADYIVTKQQIVDNLCITCG